MCAKGIHDQVSIDTLYWPLVKTHSTLQWTLNGHLDWYLDIELTPRSTLDQHSIDSSSVVCQVSINWYVLINTQWCLSTVNWDVVRVSIQCQHYWGVNEVSTRLCSSNAWLPQVTSFHFRWQEKYTLSPSWTTSFLRFNLEMKKNLTIICLSLFDFLCFIEVYKAKWLNSECLNPSVKSKHWSFDGLAQCVSLTLACMQIRTAVFLVYFV